MKKIVLLLGAGYLSSSLAAEPAKNTSPSKTPAKEEKNIQLEEMVVSDQGDKASTGTRLFPNTRLSTPSFKTTAQNVRTQVNAITSEDTLRYAPGMFISRRYAGDTGGGLHIRGSSSTQSSHSMVYADGMPLHNPVRATFNGTPRWSMVSAGEIETSEVFYGPFSAEYSGNSFGGVINMTTKMPKKFEAQFDAMGLFQTPHRNGRNEPLLGFTTFASAGNRFDKFSIWASYNHVENEGQPMTLNASGRTSPVLNTAAQRAAQARLPVVSGGENYQLPTAAPAVVYGDIGLAQAVTDLFKLKMGYDFTDDLQGRFTFAYENRKDDNSDPLSLLKNPDGTTNWGGATTTGASANTTYFNSTFNQNIVVPGSVLGSRSLDRNAYNYGLSLKGKVSDNWHIDTTASYYDARSKQVQSTLNPNHPQNKYLGQLSEDKPWWASYDLKLATDKFFGRNDLSFMGGYQFNHASLRLRTNSSNNYAAETASGLLNDNGGSTQTNALFSQMEWRFLPEWNVTAGLRYDIWQSSDGHVYNYALPANSPLRIQNYQDRNASRISPKASIAYAPNDWTFRYSFSKAYRFPIVEEMFASQSTLNNQTIAYPGLGPEHGYFHNIMAQYDIPRGYIRANVFYDTISDEIMASQQTINGQTVNTYLPIDKTESIGADLTFQQNDFFNLPVDVMFNTTVMNKQIKENARNPSLVNNQWVRIPKLIMNGTVTYHILPEKLDGTVGVRYRSKSYQTITNSDVASEVMGTTDEATVVDLKLNYKLPTYSNVKSTVSAGIDNVFSENFFVNHPFPQRSYFVNVSMKY